MALKFFLNSWMETFFFFNFEIEKIRSGKTGE